MSLLPFSIFKNKFLATLTSGIILNNRIRYMLDGVEIDIDSWPMIPTYLEIEGKDEASVLTMVEKLGLDKEKVTSLDVQSVYKEIYNID